MFLLKKIKISIVYLCIFIGINTFASITYLSVTNPLETAGVSVVYKPAENNIPIDIDSDGDIDFIAYDTSDVLKMYKNNGSGVFTAEALGFTPTTVANLNDTLVVDIDNDGDSDYIDADNVFRRNDNGTFVTATNPLEIAGVSVVYKPAENNIPIDIDSDGDIDFIAYDTLDVLKMYKNNGSGVFTAEALGFTPTTVSNLNDTLVVDIDNDGDSDYIDADNILRINNNGVFTTATNPLMTAGASVAYKPAENNIAIDIDSDGDIDFIAYDTSDVLKMYKNNGSGVFTSEALGFTPTTVSNMNDTLVVDIDNDGDSDYIDADNIFKQASGKPPKLISFSPIDNASGIIANSNIILNFDEIISRGDIGKINIYKSFDNSLFETIPGNDGRVSGFGTTIITVNPVGTLLDSTEYYFQIDKKTFFDSDGSSYNHLSKLDKTSHSFTTGITPDNDASLISSNIVVEPISLSTTRDTVGEAVSLFDFTIVDGGSSDGLTTNISSIEVNVSGTTSDSQRSKVTWRLSGPDASHVIGTYNAGANKITFSGLSLSIADGANETYTINGYFNDNTGLIENQTFILSVDGDTDLTLDSSKTQMGVTSTITNGSGTIVNITATSLAVTTQPSGSVSGFELTTQPVVTAQDAFGNMDVDFTETITLSESSAGSISGDIDVAAISGVATFTDINYTATADQQSFTLTVNDQDGVGSDLPVINTNIVTSDVVASKLSFVTQPSPLTALNSISTNLTTVPVINALDANNIIDTGYSSGITLSEVNGAGSATMTSIGDTDGNGATVTITPIGGVATFTAMQITYTASGGSSENFNLQASSGGLSTVNSSQFTGLIVDSDASLTSSSGVIEPVNLQTTVDTESEAINVFDFTISDGGTSDMLSTSISQIVVNVSGTTNDTVRDQVTWRLNGPDVIDIAGIYNPGSNTITFSGLGISIANGGSEVYTINAYFNTPSNLRDNETIILSIDGDTDIVVDGTGTQMSTTSAVTNGLGTKVDVVATKLKFLILPAK